jgi:hypothetical protein
MLEFLPTQAPTMALRVSHKITGDDLKAIMDRLEGLLKSDEKINIFVETQSIDGIEISGLASYTARALPLFGKLNRFGRVAVVADQAWIRMGTRIESAMLPFISYRVFGPEDRDAALAWVIGDTSA